MDYDNPISAIQEELNLGLLRTWPDGTSIYLGDTFDWVYERARKYKPELPSVDAVETFTIKCRFGTFKFWRGERDSLPVLKVVH